MRDPARLDDLDHPFPAADDRAAHPGAHRMRIIEHDPDREPSPEPPEPGLTFSPFATVPLGHKRELRIDLTAKGDSRAVSMRLWKSAGRGRPLAPEHPWHLFPEHLPEVIAALTAAAAALGVELPAAGHRVEVAAPPALPAFIDRPVQ